MRGHLGGVAPARLEDWFRQRYFSAQVDISSSGVENYTLGTLRQLLGLSSADLDRIAFRDSPSTGCADLVAAIAQRLAPGRDDQVMVTHGSSEAIFLALSAVVRPGDEVIVAEPAYQSLSSIAEALGARLVPWRLSAADDFAPRVERLRPLLTRATRVVAVNFPHNPTGVTLDTSQYAELTGLLAGHPAYLLWDASMAELTYDRIPLPDPGRELERSISTGTLSKAYGLPGLRVGWCIAPRDVLTSMVRMRDYTSISTSPLSEFIATAVLRQADAVLGPRLAQAAANRRVLLDWAAANPAAVSLPAPQGGVAAFPRMLGTADTWELCAELADRHGVLAVPGSCFGHPDRIRIGFGGPADELAAGLAALTDAARRHARSASPENFSRSST
jgi:capreomycidine synthase